MPASHMNLKILLPFEVFADLSGVTRIVAETHGGAFGLLPNRLDCAAALCAGILSLETETDGPSYVAIDEGVLVKTGAQVLVSVRRALGGTDLGQLRQAVAQQFLRLDDQEQTVRSVIAKLEMGFLRRMANFHHD